MQRSVPSAFCKLVLLGNLWIKKSVPVAFIAPFNARGSEMGLFPTSLTPHLSRRTLLTVSIALNFLAGLAFVFVRGPYNIPVFNPNNTMSLTEAAVRYGARVHEASKRIQA